MGSNTLIVLPGVSPSGGRPYERPAPAVRWDVRSPRYRCRSKMDPCRPHRSTTAKQDCFESCKVEPGRLEIQVPGTASAVRFRKRNDSRRNSSRSFIDRVLAEERPISLSVNRMRDEWVDYVVKRKARSGRTVIVVVAFVIVFAATLAKQRDFDARSDGIVLAFVAAAVAVAIIGETEIEIGRVGIVAGVNNLNSLLAERDSPVTCRPAQVMQLTATASERPRPTHPSKDLVSMISSLSSLLGPQALAYERLTPADAHSDVKPCQSQNIDADGLCGVRGIYLLIDISLSISLSDLRSGFDLST